MGNVIGDVVVSVALCALDATVPCKARLDAPGIPPRDGARERPPCRFNVRVADRFRVAAAAAAL